MRFKGNLVYFDDKEVTLPFEIEKIEIFSNICLILLKPEGNKKNWGQFPNLYAFDRNGNELWLAELPTSNTGESYDYLDIKNGRINVYSACSSYECFIDPKNGRIAEKIFTK